MKQLEQVHFNAAGFRKEHGHMPRGMALWIFYFSDRPEDPWIPGQRENAMLRLTYMFAKRIATLEASRRGVTSVLVDPNPL